MAVASDNAGDIRLSFEGFIACPERQKDLERSRRKSILFAGDIRWRQREARARNERWGEQRMQ